MSNGPRAPSGLAGMVAAGTVDADVAALLWLLVEGRLPVVVAGGVVPAAFAVRGSLVELLPAGTTLVTLDDGSEDFAWMPEAVELGWRREHGAMAAGGTRPARAESTVMLADLEDTPTGTWGDRARIAIRALSVGYAMLAVAGGDRLEDVLGRLAAPPVGAIDDELARLGVVLTLAPDPAPRVTAAHYLRPAVRDVHGHVQRRPPAVLATWDERAGSFEHFAWAIGDELAGRIGMRPAELERELARRASAIAAAATTSSAT